MQVCKVSSLIFRIDPNACGTRPCIYEILATDFGHGLNGLGVLNPFNPF